MTVARQVAVAPAPVALVAEVGRSDPAGTADIAPVAAEACSAPAGPVDSDPAAARRRDTAGDTLGRSVRARFSENLRRKPEDRLPTRPESFSSPTSLLAYPVKPRSSNL